VNACNHPDLFWAVKGGGGGAFGVLTKLTLRTRALPTTFGAVSGTIKAASDTRAFSRVGLRMECRNGSLPPESSLASDGHKLPKAV
jgi:hypothetical protein